MIHPGLEALKGPWDKAEYAAGYPARFTGIPDSEEAHACWRVGWEDADTDLLESARHRRTIEEGRGDNYSDTWGVLFGPGGGARVNGVAIDEERTALWKEGADRSGHKPWRSRGGSTLKQGTQRAMLCRCGSHKVTQNPKTNPS